MNTNMNELQTKEDIEIIADGTVTTPRGFTAGGVHVGVRDDWTKLDVGLLVSEQPCVAAATYTSNQLQAAPLIISRQHLSDGSARAVVANSGCANAATGDQGIANAVQMAQEAAHTLGIAPHDVVVASTGVIGTQLPMDRINLGIAQISPSADGGIDFAVAIMTTDTVPKYMAVRHGNWTIGAVCKGVGMIHPNMATMLCFMTTDANVSGSFLQNALKQAVDASFNMVDIDSDTSTNDMALVLANGMAGGGAIDRDHPDAAAFQKSLTLLCTAMARKMVHDAEGGTKLIEASVTGAATAADARKAARAIVSSIGVKTAVYGQDPNWGRPLAAVGNSGAAFDLAKAGLGLVHPGGTEIALFANGAPLDYDYANARACLSPSDVCIHVDLGLGTGAATAWGSDLTEEFVRLNSVYTT
jgi:glutamate N-acetyltransferase/amino-acid N-acetyltransferase